MPVHLVRALNRIEGGEPCINRIQSGTFINLFSACSRRADCAQIHRVRRKGLFDTVGSMQILVCVRAFFSAILPSSISSVSPMASRWQFLLRWTVSMTGVHFCAKKERSGERGGWEDEGLSDLTAGGFSFSSCVRVSIGPFNGRTPMSPALGVEQDDPGGKLS